MKVKNSLYRDHFFEKNCIRTIHADAKYGMFVYTSDLAADFKQERHFRD